MRITQIRAEDVPPIRLFEMSELSDVVVLAGPNGVGKTRLLEALIQFFRAPSAQGQIHLRIEASSSAERQKWGTNELDTSRPEHAQSLAQTLQASRRRTNWSSSVIQFESDRTIQQVRPFSFTWDFGDPWEENYGWDGTFAGLRSRFEDTIHSIFRKVQGRRAKIGRAVEDALRTGPVTVDPADYPDPIKPFQDAFAQLLAPKALLDADPERQQLTYSVDGQQFKIDQLSSGEREVVNIVFDFLLRNPEDCIVLFDEPELHLHPELSYKLLQTLRTVGRNNQFVFCTHSPDIITASLDHSVVFVAPPQNPPVNQAILVREDDETNQALRLLGHSIGIVALGRRLVLIEGQTASLDKQVYGSLLKNRHPGLVLVPSGGRGVITSFATLNRRVLEKTLWGVDFFMLCDRDAVPLSRPVESLEKEAQGRLRVLPRYHLENYFLEAQIIAKVFDQMEQEGAWLRDPDKVEAKLREVALSIVPYGVALAVSAEFRDRVGNLDAMPGDVHGRSADELVTLALAQLKGEKERIGQALEESDIERRVREVYAEFSASVAAGSDRWKVLLPGKAILSRFAGSTSLGVARLKTMYIRAAEDFSTSPFSEIDDIFASFAAP